MGLQCILLVEDKHNKPHTLPSACGHLTNFCFISSLSFTAGALGKLSPDWRTGMHSLIWSKTDKALKLYYILPAERPNWIFDLWSLQPLNNLRFAKHASCYHMTNLPLHRAQIKHTDET